MSVQDQGGLSQVGRYPAAVIVARVVEEIPPPKLPQNLPRVLGERLLDVAVLLVRVEVSRPVVDGEETSCIAQPDLVTPRPVYRTRTFRIPIDISRNAVRA